MTFWAFPGLKLTGHIREVAAAPNASTGTYDAKIVLADPPEEIAVGMTAQVSFDKEEKEKRIRIPLTAMAPQSSAPAVWVVRDHRVYLQNVEAGAYGNDTVEITGGLKKGDRIVTGGAGKLHEEDEVRL